MATIDGEKSAKLSEEESLEINWKAVKSQKIADPWNANYKPLN